MNETPEQREASRLAEIERRFARKKPHELRMVPTNAIMAFHDRLPK